MSFFPYFLMPPEWHAQQRAQEKAHIAKVLEDPLPWNLVTPPKRPVMLGVKASTFSMENPLVDIFPEVERAPGVLHTDFNASKAVSPSGQFIYRRNTLPKGQPIGVAIGVHRDENAEIVFDGDIEVPGLYEKDRYETCGWKVWMSLTPTEMWTQRTGVSFSKGTVVVGGLGMGWLLAQICKRKQVKNVIVVERSQELLDWFGNRLCVGFPKVSEVICGDVYDHMPSLYERDQNTRFVLDIWKSYGSARSDRKLLLARKAGMNVWAWGSARGGTDW